MTQSIDVPTYIIPKLYDESIFVVQRGNTIGTALASAARVSGNNSPIITSYNARGIHVFLNVSAASGTGGLIVTINEVDSITSVFVPLNTNPAAVTATGGYVYELYPGASGAAVGAVGALVQRTAASLPKQFLIRVSHVDGTNYTYSIGYSLIV